MKDVIIWQRVEGGLVFGAGLGLFALSGAGMAWWLALLAFFVPDLSFFAYGLGARVGARVYNLAHVYALGAVLMALGGVMDWPVVAGLGALWLAHSGFDRLFGYGLKAESGFEDTHLGRIGERRRGTHQKVRI